MASERDDLAVSGLESAVRTAVPAFAYPKRVASRVERSFHPVVRFDRSEPLPVEQNVERAAAELDAESFSADPERGRHRRLRSGRLAKFWAADHCLRPLRCVRAGTRMRPAPSVFRTDRLPSVGRNRCPTETQLSSRIGHGPISGSLNRSRDANVFLRNWRRKFGGPAEIPCNIQLRRSRRRKSTLRRGLRLVPQLIFSESVFLPSALRLLVVDTTDRGSAAHAGRARSRSPDRP